MDLLIHGTYRREYNYINTNKIPDELLHKKIISSHVKITLLSLHTKRVLLLWLHIKSCLSWSFAEKVKWVWIYFQNSKLVMPHPPNLKVSNININSCSGLHYKAGGFFWRSSRGFLSIVK